MSVGIALQTNRLDKQLLLQGLQLIFHLRLRSFHWPFTAVSGEGQLHIRSTEGVEAVREGHSVE